MKQNEKYPQCWTADEGKTFIDKRDGEDVGESIYLGTTDSIDNYEEVEIKDESYE